MGTKSSKDSTPPSPIIIHVDGEHNKVDFHPRGTVMAAPTIHGTSSVIDLYHYEYSSNASMTEAKGDDSGDLFPPLYNHTKISLTYNIPNSNVRAYASQGDDEKEEAKEWVKKYIKQHKNITSIHVVIGDISTMSSDDAKYVVKAMENIHGILKESNAKNFVVTTMLGIPNFSTSYEIFTGPSKYKFKASFIDTIKKIVEFLIKYVFPLIIKVMPSEIYEKNPNMDARHYLFDETAPEYMDDNGTKYKFVFDAMVDSFHGAIKNLDANYVDGDNGVKILAYTTWPSGENNIKPFDYSTKLLDHVHFGTKKRPGFLDTFIEHEEKIINHCGTLLRRHN